MGDEKLLQRARTSPHDWSPDEVVKLLTSFGFECWEGKRHAICRHSVKRDVYHVVPRHRRLRSYVVREAVRLIDSLLAPRGAE